MKKVAKKRPSQRKSKGCLCDPKRRSDQIRTNPYCKALHAGDEPTDSYPRPWRQGDPDTSVIYDANGNDIAITYSGSDDLDAEDALAATIVEAVNAYGQLGNTDRARSPVSEHLPAKGEAMKILVLCDQGNNRSVVIAHHLKYWKHDVIPAGLATNSERTLAMLFEWADRIICTESNQNEAVMRIAAWTRAGADEIIQKLQLWPIGPDIYPRPFNKELLAIVRQMMEERKAEYKP